MAGGPWEVDNTTRKLFHLVGFAAPSKEEERLEIVRRIESLGGEIDLESEWNENCTHIIAANFHIFSAKVLIGLAAGKWIVTKRYVDKSFKNGSWSNPKAFICDEKVLLNRKMFHQTDGLFSHLKVLFLLDNKARKKVYETVAEAGGASVFKDWDIDSLLLFRPAPSELNCIVVDPYIISNTDPRYAKFQEWRTYASKVWIQEEGDSLTYIYYKYFFEMLHRPTENLTLGAFSILNPRVLDMARVNGDLKVPNPVLPTAVDDAMPPRGNVQAKKGQGSIPALCNGKRSSEASEERGNKKFKNQLVQHTIEPNVVNLSDDDSDDDIEILVMKLREDAKAKRVFIEEIVLDTSVEISSDNDEIQFVEDEDRVSDDNEDDDSRSEGSDEDITETGGNGIGCENDKPTDAMKDDVHPEVANNASEVTEKDKVSKMSEAEPVIGIGASHEVDINDKETEISLTQKPDQIPAQDDDDDIYIDKIVPKRPQEAIVSKRGQLFMAKLKQLEETKACADADMLSQNLAAPEEPKIVEIADPLEKLSELSLEDPEDPRTVSINKIFANILDRQLVNDEGLEISHGLTKTARYDKNNDHKNWAKFDRHHVKGDVFEEFYSIHKGRQKNDDKNKEAPLRRGNDGSDSDDDEEFAKMTRNCGNISSYLESLDYINLFTNLQTHPTSAIIHIIITDYIMEQPSVHIAYKSYQYLDKFLFLRLGSHQEDRKAWLELILSALRDCEDLNQYAEFSIENNNDIHMCWSYFVKICKSIEEELKSKSTVSSSWNVLFQLLVKIIQNDFDAWWKPLHQGKQKDVPASYPVLFYLLNGKTGVQLVDNVASSLLNLYKTLLSTQSRLLVHARKLIAMTGMLIAYMDYQDKDGLLFRGLKRSLAGKLEQAITSSAIASHLFCAELELLRPSWLAMLVAKRYLHKAKDIELKSLSQIMNNLESISDASEDKVGLALDALVEKTVATSHSHTLLRTQWLNESSKLESNPFNGLSRLDSSPNKSSILRFQGDVILKKSEVIQDANVLRAHHSAEKVCQQTNSSCLPFLLFKMSSPIEY